MASGKQSLIKKTLACAGMVMLLASSPYPCSMVFIGGIRPLGAREIAGTVMDWDRKSFGIIEGNRMKAPVQIPLEGAFVEGFSRVDTRFLTQSDIQPQSDKEALAFLKQSIGSVTEYECTTLVARTRSGAGGSFRISDLKSGKYCLWITRPWSENAPMYSTVFIVDVLPSAAKDEWVVNISEQQPDCTGGPKLGLKSTPGKYHQWSSRPRN